jgi:hypothetical protein
VTPNRSPAPSQLDRLFQDGKLRRIGHGTAPFAQQKDDTEVPVASRIAARCCGQLSIEVQGEPQGIGLCHCLACQQRTGSVFAAPAGFLAPYKVSGKATEFIRTGDQGAKFGFRFGPVCGSNVSTPRRATRTSGSPWRSAHSRIQAFRHRRTRCTTRAAMPGCSCPRG